VESAQIIGTLGISMASNLFCILVLYGIVQLSKAEREGTKPPTYLFVLVLVPAAIMLSCIWFITYPVP
jgi:hypothetical protein